MSFIKKSLEEFLSVIKINDYSCLPAVQSVCHQWPLVWNVDWSNCYALLYGLTRHNATHSVYIDISNVTAALAVHGFSHYHKASLFSVCVALCVCVCVE